MNKPPPADKRGRYELLRRWTRTIVTLTRLFHHLSRPKPKKHPRSSVSSQRPREKCTFKLPGRRKHGPHRVSHWADNKSPFPSNGGGTTRKKKLHRRVWECLYWYWETERCNCKAACSTRGPRHHSVTKKSVHTPERIVWSNPGQVAPSRRHRGCRIYRLGMLCW